jgi:NADH-quinone oxidoreductase subunit N
MAINAALGAWYYLRMVAAMYLRQPGREQKQPSDVPLLAGLGVCAAFVLLTFAFPAPLWNAIRAAAPAAPTPAAVGKPAGSEPEPSPPPGP